MPRYSYRCDRCGKISDDLRRMADKDEPGVCKRCGGVIKRNLEAECKKSIMKSGENIRNSRSLAMSESDIKSGKAFKTHPGANFGEPNRAGMCPMVIHDRREKLKRIKERSKALGTPLQEM